MASRDQTKAEDARTSIRAEIPGASLESVPLDLASLASVREAAARIVAAHPRIDILVNDAGVMAIFELRTEDGLEMQLGVNHLGHFALTALLLPALLERRRPHRLGHVHRPPLRPADRSREPASRGAVRPLERVRSVDGRERHFALELERRIPCRGRAGKEQRGASVVREHRPAGAKRARYRRRPHPALLPERRRTVRHVAGPRCARAAPGGDRSERRRRRPLLAEVGELGPPIQRPLFGRSRSRKALTTLWEVSEHETGFAFDVPRAGVT
jgi:hypothetical protein